MPTVLLDYNTQPWVFFATSSYLAKWCFLPASKVPLFLQGSCRLDCLAQAWHAPGCCHAQIGPHLVVNIRTSMPLPAWLVTSVIYGANSQSRFTIVGYTVIPDNHWLPPSLSLSIVNNPQPSSIIDKCLRVCSWSDQLGWSSTEVPKNWRRPPGNWFRGFAIAHLHELIEFVGVPSFDFSRLYTIGY